MDDLLTSLVRTSAFVRKEIYEVLRQPRLLITLVLGPFLILLILGIGYQNKPRALRTLFVVQKDSAIKSQLEQYATTLGPQLIYVGAISDEGDALKELRQGKVDLVAVAPLDAYKTIQSNKQAVFVLFHREIDPQQVSYVQYFGSAYIDEVNRRVLVAVTQRGQKEAVAVEADLKSAHDNLDKMRTALQAGDVVTARQHLSGLSQNLNDISLAVGAGLALLGNVEQTLGSGDGSTASAILSVLSDLRQNTDALNSLSAAPGVNPEELNKISQMENDLKVLDSNLSEFTGISPEVLVRPFRSEAKSITKIQPSAMDFFAPAVIALLLQHLAITMAALSIVREHAVGTMELFRVSPLSAGQTLMGKYLSYMLFGAALTLVLTAVLIVGLKMPMLGSWFYYLLVMAALLFTSLSIGFVISLVSQNDSQAVQLTMLVLLASVFFSGFLMNLDMLSKPVRVLSWSLPTTYGIIMLRNIFLRGDVPDLTLLGELVAIGVVMCVIAWLLLRRLITTS
jgi:ABC-2 type transport system permease protein